jgi:hypothetical protein
VAVGRKNWHHRRWPRARAGLHRGAAARRARGQDTARLAWDAQMLSRPATSD